MAMIALDVPRSIARHLRTTVPLTTGVQWEPIEHHHVTLVHFEGPVDPHQTAAYHAVLTDVAQRTPAFPAYLPAASVFYPKEGKTTFPILVTLLSSDLHHLRAELCRALDRALLPYSNSFPVFRPHITLGYTERHDLLDPPWFAPLYRPVVWHVHAMALHTGVAPENPGDPEGGAVVSVPLAPPAPRTTLARTLSDLVQTPR